MPAGGPAIAASRDALARFLETPVMLPRSARVAGAPPPYAAFEVGDREARYVEICFRLPAKMSVCLQYEHLVEINGDWRFGKSIVLVFTRTPHPIVVKLDGENLHDLHDALMRWRASAIVQFDPGQDSPVSPGQPVIHTIALTRTPPAAAAAAKPAPGTPADAR